MFILGFNLVAYILKVSVMYLIFILGFNMVIFVSFVTCDRQFTYMDRYANTCPIETLETSKLTEKDQLMQMVKT
jgi:hypothetical protein